jgi:hypothetical protein
MSLSFTKLFSSITESTVWMLDAPTRLVWITLLAMADRKGRVHASVPGLANRARVTVEECQAAIQCFLSPDPWSRTPDREGRRIEPIDGGWFLINHGKHMQLRDEETHREQKREWIANKRRRERSTNVTVEPSRTASNHGDLDVDLDVEKKERDIGHKRFEPPASDDVRDFFAKQGSSDYLPFLAFYESNGWKVGKNVMKNWKAAAAGWIMRNGTGRASNVR